MAEEEAAAVGDAGAETEAAADAAPAQAAAPADAAAEAAELQPEAPVEEDVGFAATPEPAADAAPAPAPAQAEQGAPGPAGGAASPGCESFMEAVAQQDVVKAYEEACKAAGRKPSHLVVMSLQTSIEAGKPTFFLEAPGSHKLAFTSRLTDADMAVFAQVFPGLARHLSVLDLSYNQLTDPGAQALATSVLSANAVQLRSFSLRSNSIGPAGCEQVCQALLACPSLQRFDFSHNPLGREGGLHVVKWLRRSPNLLELHLQDTEADIDVVVAVADALLDPQLELRVCNLENPRILTLQEEHVVHLGRMLQVNTKLAELYAGKIKMRDEGLRQLVSCLIENRSLRVLDLRCNELGADSVGHLNKLVSSNTGLATLNLANNRIPKDCNFELIRSIATGLPEP